MVKLTIRSRPPPSCRLPWIEDIAQACAQRTAGKDCSKLLQKMSHSMGEQFPFGLGQGFSNTWFRFEPEFSDLLMKQESIWISELPVENHDMLEKGMLYDIRALLRDAQPICEHCKWDEEYGFLVRRTKFVSLELGHRMAMPDRLQCALFHKVVGCQCRDSSHFAAV